MNQDQLLDQERFSKICKSLGHPVRVQIVQYLKEVDQCICGDIVALLPLAQSTVSQHLRSLKECGLIDGQIEGPRTCYCLNYEVLKRFKATVNAL